MQDAPRRYSLVWPGCPGGPGGPGGPGSPSLPLGPGSDTPGKPGSPFSPLSPGKPGAPISPGVGKPGSRGDPHGHKTTASLRRASLAPFAVGRTSSRPPLGAGCSNREAAPACRTYMQLGQGSLRRPCKAQGLTVQALTAAHPQQVRQRTLPVCSERKGTETPLSRADVVGTGPEPAEKESGRGGGPGQERDAEAAGRASAGRQARPP